MTQIGSSLTVDTAPRDPNELASIGRFQLRRLAEALNLLNDDKSRQAFMSAGVPEMTQAVSTALRAYDASKKNGVNGAAVAAPAQEQAPAQAAPAAQEEAAPPKREPRTTKSTAAAQAAPSDEGLAQLVELLKNTQAELMAQTKASVLMGKALEAVNAQLGILRGDISGIAEKQSLVVSLSVMLASQSMDAPLAEILGAASDDIGTIQDVINKLRGAPKDSGKAGK